MKLKTQERFQTILLFSTTMMRPVGSITSVGGMVYAIDLSVMYLCDKQHVTLTCVFLLLVLYVGAQKWKHNRFEAYNPNTHATAMRSLPPGTNGETATIKMLKCINDDKNIRGRHILLCVVISFHWSYSMNWWNTSLIKVTSTDFKITCTDSKTMSTDFKTTI